MKSLIAESRSRVETNTSRSSLARIRRGMERNVRTYSGRGRAAIDRRLKELDREWDIERAIEANASTIALTGTVLGFFVNRWFLALPTAVTAFLLQHAIQGWCPPVPLLRRLGFRTSNEIWEERVALKAIRGDFRGAKAPRRRPAQTLAASRR